MVVAPPCTYYSQFIILSLTLAQILEQGFFISPSAFVVSNGHKKAGERFPGDLDEAQTIYRLILRRNMPARTMIPEPNIISVPGSGAAT